MHYLCCRHVQLTLNAVSQLEQYVNVRFFYKLEKSALETCRWDLTRHLNG